MKKLFFVMVNSIDESMALDLESRVTRNELLRPSILSFKVLWSGITIGLTFRLCGATGVITKFFDPGNRIGPPQLRE